MSDRSGEAPGGSSGEDDRAAGRAAAGSADAQDPGTARGSGDDTGTTPQPAAPHPGLAHRFRPTGSLAVALRIVFTAWLAMEAYGAGALAVLFRITDAQADNLFAYSAEALDRQIEVWDSLYVVELIFSLTLVVLFIAWMFRAYGNLPALGARGARYARGWAIGSWFIPFGNLVIPKQIADDLWRSSDPDWEPADWKWVGASWHRAHVDRRVHLWWATLLVGRFVIVFANSRIESASDLEGIRTAVVAAGVGILVQMASAVLAVWMVAGVAARQAHRVRATGREVSDRDATRRLGAQVWATPFVVLAVAAGAYLFLDPGDPIGTAVGTSTGHGTALYESHGIVFEYDEDLIASETGVYGDEASDFAGVVFLATADQSTAAFITWITGPTSGVDAEEFVDSTIYAGAEGYGPTSQVVLSDRIDLSGGPTPFVAKTFRIDGDLGRAGGAVASGSCPGTDRQVTILHAVEGRFEFQSDARDNSSIQFIEGLLATLDC